MSQQLENLRIACENQAGKNARRSGSGYRLPCPAHNGKDHNLYIADGDNRLIIHCHSNGCDPKNVMESVGLSLKDLFYEQLPSEQASEYKTIAQIKSIRREMEFELLILLCWISDTNKLLFPIGSHDIERTKQAIKRIYAATAFFIKEGVQ